MEKIRKVTVFLIFLALVISLGIAQATDESIQEALKKKGIKIMPIDKIKPGMTGTGKTVFGGPEPQIPENFNLTIHPDKAKILYGIKDKQIILAILSGGRNNVINKAGVIAGMSGSPSFINKKLIGAVAYSFNIFATEPLAGITPIEEMLALVTQKEFAPKVVIPPELRVPLFASGLSPRAINMLEEKLQESAPWIKIRPAFCGMGTGSSSSNLNLDLNDGDAISVALMVGDFNLVGTGTVTLRLDDLIWAFGHPFFWMGKSNWPFFKADIATISSSTYDSYKLKAKIYPQQLGTIFIDDLSAIIGKLDRKDTMLPINVDVRIKEGSRFEKRENFKFKIAQKNPYSDILLFIGLMNSIFVSSPELQNTLVKLETKITYYPTKTEFAGLINTSYGPFPIIKVEKSKTEKTLVLPQGFFLGKQASWDLYSNIYLVARLYQFLEEANIDIKDISFKTTLTKNLAPADVPVLRVVDVISNKYITKPGKRLEITLVLEDKTQYYKRLFLYTVPTQIGNQEFGSGSLTIRIQDFKTRLRKLLIKDISKPENVRKVLSFIEKAKKNVLYAEIEIVQDITKIKSSTARLKEKGIMRTTWIAKDKEKAKKLTTKIIPLSDPVPIEKIVDIVVNRSVLITITR